MTIQPSTDIGRYHILEQLGEGGMALVYKAYDTRLETQVAVKVIRVGDITPNALPRILKRFQIEAKKMAQMTHPNIVRVLDYGEYQGAPYLVMPYLQGGTLKNRLGKPMDWREAIRLLLPIADALGYAHKKGLIHRDIKPSNILITEEGQPMLSDFGVAKVLESEETLELTGTGMGVGTPEYMAPEQGEGRAIDHRADIYSLGIVLYELVTGRKPFQADTPMAVIVKQMRDPLPNPTKYNPQVPEEVEQVLFKMLAKFPDNRFMNMGEISRSFNRLVDIKGDEYREEDKGSFLNREKHQNLPSKRFTEEQSLSKKTTGFIRQWKYLLVIIAVVSLLLIITILVKSNQKSEKSLLKTSDQSQSLPTVQPKVASTIENHALGPTAGLEIKSEMISKIDGMTLIYIPPGEFEMGSLEGDSDEKPAHMIYLDGYWMDQTEISNRMYAMCVKDGVCSLPMATGSQTRKEYYENAEFADYPVIYVNWNQADTYCRWAGRNLPTEAQWEKAARGEDSRIFPWGDASPNSAFLNFNANDGDTTKTGSYLQGASSYNVLDMAGNVWEWTADWYEENYYSSREKWQNPSGPQDGSYRVQRGGSWGDKSYEVRTTNRQKKYPSYANNFDGFRCAVYGESVDLISQPISREDNKEFIVPSLVETGTDVENQAILLSENFEGQVFEGTIPTGWSQWQVMAEGGNENNSVLSINMLDSDLYPETFQIGSYSWKDTVLKIRLRIEKCGTNGGSALIDLGGRYYLNLSCLHDQIYFNEWDAPNIFEANTDISEGKWYELVIDNRDSKFSLFVNGVKQIYIENFPIYPGAFQLSTDPNSWVIFDDILILQKITE